MTLTLRLGRCGLLMPGALAQCVEQRNLGRAAADATLHDRSTRGRGLPLYPVLPDYINKSIGHSCMDSAVSIGSRKRTG